MTQEKNVEI